MNKPGGISNASLKPLRWWEYILFFGIPTILMASSVYLIHPHLVSLGISEFLGMQLASFVPYIALFMAALTAYKLEGYPWTWKAFRGRLRLRKLIGHEWIWVLALIFFSYASYLPLKYGISTLILKNFIVLPASIPRIIDPRREFPLIELTGGPVKGDWLLVGITFVVLVFNILGEELWWRGYLLPRQEISLGGKAWFVHGLLWTIFHTFKYWELIAILPVSLALSFVAQHQKNTWPGIIAHFSVNCLGTLGILILVAG